MCKESERERVGRIPSRQGGKGRAWGAPRRTSSTWGGLRRDLRGGGVLGAVVVLGVAAEAVFPGRGSTRGHSARIYSNEL